MSTYLIELWGCVEVEASNKWDAIELAWRVYENGEEVITEATVLTDDDMEGVIE